ncbi:MAG: hypothetical protein ABIG30_00780 [Candidatus Aenigmatarchaeota archaeon]
MVWARTRLSIWDYVFEPVKEILINYVGKDPSKFYKKINELIRVVFNVPEGYVQEKTYDWQKTKDGEKFSVSWEVNKLYDQFTFLGVEIELRGGMRESEGKASITIKPRVVTEYPQDTIWQQNLFYEMLRRFWHSIFYHKKRMEYLDRSREIVTNFETELKHFAEELRS